MHTASLPTDLDHLLWHALVVPPHSGQTGTGKTHTMMGEHGIDMLDSDLETQRCSFGIIPRVVQDLFTHANLVQSRQGCVVNVVASYLEIYNDRLYDLLQVWQEVWGASPERHSQGC